MPFTYPVFTDIANYIWDCIIAYMRVSRFVSEKYRCVKMVLLHLEITLMYDTQRSAHTKICIEQILTITSPMEARWEAFPNCWANSVLSLTLNPGGWEQPTLCTFTRQEQEQCRVLPTTHSSGTGHRRSLSAVCCNVMQGNNAGGTTVRLNRVHLKDYKSA